MSDGPEPLRVFERRLGRARAAGLGALAVLAVAALWASLAHRAALEDLVATLGAPFGLETTWVPRVAIALGPLAALIVLVVRTAARTGRCAVDEDLLVFEPGLWPAWMARTVIAPDQVLEREPVAGGVVVRAGDLSAIGVRLHVPVEGPADLEVALAHLDRRPEPPVVRAGRASSPPWLVGLGVLFCVEVVAALALVPWLLGRRFDDGWSLHGAGGVILMSLAVSPCLLALSPYVRRVFVGRRRLAVGEELFDHAALTTVGLGEGFLACAVGGRTCLAWVGEGEAAVRHAVAARLQERGRAVDELVGPLPPAAGRLRRRLRTAMLVAPAFVAQPLMVLLASTAPNHELERLAEDVHGQRLLVVTERDREAPTATLLVAGAPDGAPTRIAVRPAGWWAWTLGPTDAEIVVDLERGELRDPEGGVLDRFEARATFVHVTHDRRAVGGRLTWGRADWRGRLLRRSMIRAVQAEYRPKPGSGVEVDGERSVPATLEDLDLHGADLAVERAALGWTTRRCFSVRRGADELVWGVDAGRVAFVVRTDGSAGWRVVRDGLGFDLPAFDTHFTGCVVEDGPVALTMTQDGLVADPTLPTDHTALLEVRRRVQAGATLAEAMAAPGKAGTDVPR